MPQMTRRGQAPRSFLHSTAAIGAVLVTLSGAAIAQSYSFNAVEISGNERIADATILSYAGISRGERVDAGRLNDAAQSIRATGLFDDVSIVPRGGTLVVNVTERPTINRVVIEGNSKLKDESLLPRIQSQSRRALDPAVVAEDANILSRAYAEQGRVNAVVQPRVIRRDNNRVDLVFEVAEGGITEVERIGFVGNRSFSDGRLRRVLETKQAGLLRAVVRRDTYSAERTRLDRTVLTEFYNSRGYADFQITGVDVSLSEERDRYLITYNLREGQQFHVGDVQIISEIPGVDAELFKSQLRLRPGAVFSPLNIDADIDRLERVALREGINFLRVEPRITRDDRGVLLNVTYALTEGPRIFVERINISGNTSTLDRVVREQFVVVEGDPFNPRQIRESAERIRALGFFGNADIDSREGSSPDQRIVEVKVDEQPTGSLSFGGNYSTENGPSLLANFKERNFLGRGQYLSAGLELGEETRSANFGFREPTLLGRNVTFGFDANFYFTDQKNGDYNTSTANLSPSLTFPVSENGRLQVYYSYNFTEITDLPPIGGPDQVSNIIRREADLGKVSTHALGYGYSWDSQRGGSVEDDWRFSFRFGQKIGKSNADQTFIESRGEAFVQKRFFNDDVTFRGTIEAGHLNFSDGYSRVTDRYFMGGSIMRGFKGGGIGPRDAATDDALGGNSFAAARLDLQFPLGLPEEYGIMGGAFVDYGSLWDVGNTSGATVLYDDYSARSVAGLSLFWTTPIGPLRFNFSRAFQIEDRDQENNFDITISSQF